MKVNEFDFRKLPQDLIDFKDEVTTILNFGKYASQVLYNVGSTPTWDGREGEQVLSYVGAGGTYMAYTFYWLNSAWRYTTWLGTT